MDYKNYQIQTLALVFIGSFNPMIMQPFWLANKGLIREQEASDTKVEVIHNELVRYELDWVFVEMTRDRFILKTTKEPAFEPVRDLAASIFDLLGDTPIEALGINHVFHYSLRDADAYYEFGNKLVPLSNWNGFMDAPRLGTLETIENKRKDGKAGNYKVKIQPSDMKLNHGVMITANDHYSFDNKDFVKMSLVLKENWDNSRKRANEVIEKLFKVVS